MKKADQLKLVSKIAAILKDHPEEFDKFSDKYTEIIFGYYGTVREQKGLEYVAGLLFFGYQMGKEEAKNANTR